MSMLVGRDTELSTVLAGLAALTPRRPTLVEITGDPGAGKTAFLTRLLRELPDGFHAVAAHRWTPTAVARLGRLSRIRPVVAVLDDAHRAEPAGLAAWWHLLDAAPAGRLALVCAYRPRQAPPDLLRPVSGGWTRRLSVPLGALSAPAAQALLPPELPAARRTLLATVAGGLPGLLAVLAVHPELVDPDGTLVLERVVELGPSRPLAGLLGPEADLADQSTRRVLHAVAVLGELADPGAVAEVGQQRRAVVVDALDRLVRLDLLRYPADGHLPQPRHALVRAAAYRDAPARWRAGAHLRAEAALRQRGADPATRGWHLLRAGPAAPRFARLHEVTRELVAVDPPLAARLGALAVTLAPAGDPAARAAALLVQARATAAAGDLTRALRLAQASLDTGPGPDARPGSDPERSTPPDGAARPGPDARPGPETRSGHDGRPGSDPEHGRETRLAAVVLRAELAGLLGHGVSGLAVLAREHAGTAARQRPRLAVAQGRLAARHGRWEELNRLVPEVRAATGAETDAPLAAVDAPMAAVARSTLAAGAAAYGLIEVAVDEVRAAEALVDAMSDRDLAGCLDVPEWLAWVQGVVLQKEEALRHVTRAVGLAREHGQLHVLPGLLAGQARIAAGSGRLTEAITAALEAERVGRSVGARQAVGVALTYRAMALLWHAGPHAAAPVGAEAVRATRDDPTLRDTAVAVLSHIRFAQGRHAEARQLISTLIRPGRGHLHQRHIQPKWLAGHAEFLVAGGMLDEAYVWSQRAEAAAADLGLPIRRAEAQLATAQVLLARRDPGGALAAAQNSVRLFAGQQADLWLGEAHLMAAGCFEALREPGPARDHIHLARVIAERTPSAWLREQVVNAQRRNGAGRRRVAVVTGHDLTQAERRVAVLVAEGLTNRAVAVRLYVTERTVEAHLTRVYRKLGVRSRAALAALLRDGGGPLPSGDW
ncbi:helix-turn-helix transcriptional regulator [Micromonospora cathayae]|uniref:LuxR C-terminal-related transcriptional regulator n=1 Tax=Micromonospora cathayae TaxID=3028804 RepID=A0ABY7ZUK7_9ACTN|nr:LuxR C-terminal-related transcriptional regulator [Micromonospora sp. HUAS 3]WDZ86563.1 LuxR C-terminal-related transcriptional regulator [Micromonospora sp. HUAS 3]